MPAIARIGEEQRFPGRLRSTRAAIYLDGFDHQFETAQLSVRLKSDSLNVHQLGNYLLLMDRMYVLLADENPISYAKSDGKQLKITDTKPGSLEILIDIFKSIDPARIVVLFLALKYLPAIIRAIPGAISDIALAYRNFHDAREIRRRLKKPAAAQLQDEEALSGLTKDEYRTLVNILLFLYSRQTDHLRQIERFMSENQIDIKLRRKAKRNDSDLGTE